MRVLPGLPLSLLVGPAAWPRGLPRRHGNFACNSLLGISNFEFVSLELQRFWVVSKNDRGKLRAKFVWATPTALGCLGLARVLRTRPCSPALRRSPAPPAPPTPSGPSGLRHTLVGVLRH